MDYQVELHHKCLIDGAFEVGIRMNGYYNGVAFTKLVDVGDYAFDHRMWHWRLYAPAGSENFLSDVKGYEDLPKEALVAVLEALVERGAIDEVNERSCKIAIANCLHRGKSMIETHELID